MDTETKKLSEERDALKRSIASAQQRIADIDEYLRLRAKVFGAPPMIAPFNLQPQTNVYAKSKKDTILDACDALLAGGVRMSSRELLKNLKSQGIEVGGADEALTVSSYLSREKNRYVADRKLGWGLASPPKKEKPGSALTLPGLVS